MVAHRPAHLAPQLLDWYGRHHRDLPWRNGTDAYGVWISECMLQQTQVATVVDYYRRWMKRFPDVVSLAAADLQDVLKVWAGLGYYARARHLHTAAQVILSKHQGRVPSSVEELLELPGVGRYTAGAIASIAYGVAAPAVDGNVRRVLARLNADAGEPESSWPQAQALLEAAPDRQAGDLNQALMELGATLCTARRPQCLLCPLQASCQAAARGAPEAYPNATRRVVVRTLNRVSVAVARGTRWLLMQRPARGLWAGLWEFPQYPRRAGQDIGELVQSSLGIQVALEGRFASVKHALTHRRMHFDCYRARAVRGRVRRGLYQEYRWLPTEAIPTLPLATCSRKIIARLPCKS